ncbi:hypothetical protein I6A84_31685 [Frankia sp. CNm7]|uniref:DUF4190 domain-containing protein n=1 Tax=Frankia nepalensis TaxID=1836974 RepID=A0A937RFJ1_9ACTN|nr:hypothetical protein [Frankia nepalensis]MBL7500475.1 hypothetical protein [Frankia nepalensis]MBL7512827.1 hypothetical protein [Frankia nepalensis]MBL7522526.1 hypothetical protein [Frankia nepalensis]MBL7631233.1 hypothetical protein [Frankia nepalensis]
MKQTIVSEAAEKARSVHDSPGRAFGIWSFVLSFFVPVLALIFGIIALLQSRRAGMANRLAIAGIVISVVLIVTGMIIWISIAAAGGS